jgi:hypothetical protein
MKAKDQIEGYVRCETLMPILGMQILPIPEMPTRRALALLTEDGSLALGVTAESAQELSDLLAKAAAEMRRASRRGTRSVIARLAAERGPMAEILDRLALFLRR